MSLQICVKFVKYLSPICPLYSTGWTTIYMCQITFRYFISSWQQFWYPAGWTETWNQSYGQLGTCCAHR